MLFEIVYEEVDNISTCMLEKLQVRLGQKG